MYKKIHYADMVSLTVTEKMLAIDSKGEAFCLDIANCEESEDAITADLAGKYEGMISITSSVCIINNFTNNLVYVDSNGISSEALDGSVFFKH